MSALPTREQMLDNAVQALDEAYRALGDAADWLRSDWTPPGSPLTDEQAARRTQMLQEIAAAKTAINRAKNAPN